MIDFRKQSWTRGHFIGAVSLYYLFSITEDFQRKFEGKITTATAPRTCYFKPQPNSPVGFKIRKVLNINKVAWLVSGNEEKINA